MASGRILDPASLFKVEPSTALALAPLITASCSVWYSWDQYLFFSRFVQPEIRTEANAVLGAYWRSFFAPGLVGIFSLYGLSVATGVANFLSARPQGSSSSSSSSSSLYLAGACFAAAHFLFAPAVAGPIDRMSHGTSKVDNVEEQRSWLKVHVVRTLTVDIPGWVCFFLAAAHTLQVV